MPKVHNLKCLQNIRHFALVCMFFFSTPIWTGQYFFLQNFAQQQFFRTEFSPPVSALQFADDVFVAPLPAEPSPSAAETGALLGLVCSMDVARVDAANLKRSLLFRGASLQSIGEESQNGRAESTLFGNTVQIGSRVSLMLDATFLDGALEKD